MEIEDKGELKAFETMPTEGTLYLTAVCYGGASWMAGPASMDKAEVVKALVNWTGATKARIYSVKVPLVTLDAA